MRVSIGLAAVLVGLALAGSASAQSGFGFSQTSQVNQLSSPQKRGYISLPNFLGGSFRLQSLFGDWGNISNRNYIGSSKIPRPDSPEYLKAFGFRRVQ